MNIYFREADSSKTIKELLLSGFIIRYIGSERKFVTTFKDEACKDEDCYPARRSFNDLLWICRTYFPETTEEQLAKVLKELYEERSVRGLYCPNIHKIVFIGTEGTSMDFMHNASDRHHHADEYTGSYIENLLKYQS